MTDLEQQLRTTLEEKGDAALGGPPTLTVGLRRRIRRRQAVTVALTAAVAGIVAAGSAVTIAQVLPQRPPARPVEQPTEQTPELLPVSPDIEWVAGSGVARGERWELVVTHRADGWCIGVQQESGGGLGCPHTGDPIEIGASVGTDLPKFVYGSLSERVARVEATTANREPLRIRVFDVPERIGAPFDQVFIVVVERGPVLVTAYDANGDVIGSARS